MIPEQLKDMKFVKVKPKSKRPLEKGWQNKFYSKDEIWYYLQFSSGNYGVHGGYEYKKGVRLGLLDDDTENFMLHKIFEKNFGETFQVRGHLYVGLIGWDGSKIIFNNKEKEHLGELQGIGSQGIGPGSTHPSGEKYEIIKNKSIIEIDWKEFERVFFEYIEKKESVKVEKEPKKSDWEGDSVSDIPITNIISLVGLENKGKGKYQGSNPIHGSNTGMNFVVDTNSNTWYCFRHQSGGGPAEMIAVVEGIIDCSQAKKGCLDLERGREVIKSAREKYGLKEPEYSPGKKDWWAEKLGINIRKYAERNNFTKCPKCNKEYEFNEEKGFFKCPECNDKGGIKKFTEKIQN